jgi:peptidyl-prolyl cis-trans isomerase D
MLDAMRKRASSWFVRALLLVLIASFAVWGIGDMFMGRQDVEVAATVGDIEVPLREVDRAFENDRQALSEQLGVPIDRQQAAAFGLLNRSLQSVVARALVDQHRRDLGLGVSDAEVAAAIRADPFFQSAGSFDRFRFDSFLRQAGMSEAQFAESVRRDIGRNRILAPLRNLAEAPAPLVERLGRYRGETRSGTLLVVPRAEMAVGEPDDAELQALLEEEAARFTAPEYRSVSLVTLSTEALVDEIEIEESRLRAEYEARRDFYTRGERRRAGQLLASDREVIEAAAAALAEGAVFADLATSMAADGLTYSTLGPTTAADLPDEFAEAIFALDEGEVSEPVESLFGWHLFRVIEIEPEDVLSFAEVRDDIRRDLALDAALDQLPRFAAALDDEIAAGASLEDAAGTVGVELRRFAALDATGRGPDGRPLPDAPAQEILAAIFAAPEGEVSLLEETADGTFFVFRVEAVQPPQRRALEDVRDEVVALWRQREQDSLAAERVEEIMANARAGRTLEAIAADLGDEVVLRSFEPLRRTADGAAAGLTPEAVAALFDTKAGELIREPVPTVEGKAMLRTDTVTVPDASAAAEVAAELKAGIANDILVQYEAALRGRYPVQVNNAALASLFPDEAF